MSDYILIDGTLYHHGIKGQKWGLRRWQNEDGSLTSAGREHYGYGIKRQAYEAQKMIYKATKKDARKARLDSYMYDNRHPISRQFGAHRKISNEKAINAAMHTRAEKEAKQLMNKAKQEYKNSDEYKQAKKDTIKKAAIAGAAVVGAGLAAYGAYKIYKDGKLNKEMQSINSHIKDGKMFTEMMRTGKKTDVLSEKVSYLGNDLRMHTAEKTYGKDGSSRYINLYADTQQPFKNLKEYKKALKNRK